MPALSDDEAEPVRLSNQADTWRLTVLNLFPDATRPDVAFLGYVTQDEYLQRLADCYTSAGIPFDRGTDANGAVIPTSGMTVDRSTEANAVGAFVCGEQHPVRPAAPLDGRVLGWLYDYLTQFLAPCYEANGIRNPPPPSRADFISQWPNQNWWPSSGQAPMGSAEDMALQAACPPPA